MNNLIIKRTQPELIAPMLATLTDRVFSDPDWIYERKLDGMRCILNKKGDQINIWSRNNKLQNNVFPELVTALKRYPSDFILDCEVVTFIKTTTSFERLQERLHVQNPDSALMKRIPVVAYVFDILFLNGYDLTKLTLLDRKKIIKQNFKFAAPYKLLNYRKTNGARYFEYARRHNWEGLIAKQASSTYLNRRSRTWLKMKCNQDQEFVIGGYTKPRGQRVMFGALLVGYYENGRFKYAGKVGTGFNASNLLLLLKKMQPLETNESPFSDYNPVRNNAIQWINPKLVIELRFTEWTAGGHLRHPNYLGLRNDKKHKLVIRESK
jgi:bifunctional non-homologous end joining protein LigD